MRMSEFFPVWFWRGKGQEDGRSQAFWRGGLRCDAQVTCGLGRSPWAGAAGRETLGQDAEARSRGLWGDRIAHDIRTPQVRPQAGHIPGLFHLILKFPQTQLPAYREKPEAAGLHSGEGGRG